MGIYGGHPIRVVVAHRHPLTRLGLRAVLESEPGLIVVGDAGGGEALLEMLDNLQPQALVINPQLSGVDEMALVARVVEHAPALCVVLLGSRTDWERTAPVLQGRAAFVDSTSPACTLLDTLRDWVLGSTLGNGNHAPLLPLDLEYRPRVLTYNLLTPREREILILSAEGCTARAIAEKLALSPRTVEKHRANLEAKLGVHRHADLVLYAMRCGMLGAETEKLHASRPELQDAR